MKIVFKSADLAEDLQKNIRNLSNPVPFFNSANTGLVNRARLNARNKGGRSFWEKIGDSVTSEQGEKVLRVKSEMPEAIHAEYGGVIRARFRSMLTIPVHGDAKREDAEFFKLKYGKKFYIIRIEGTKDSKGKALLVVQTGRGKAAKIKPIFVLKRETKVQKPRPWWLTDAQIDKVLNDNIRFWLAQSDGSDRKGN